MGLGRLLVRGAVGGLFAGHGAQKLFGWFGGGGPAGTGQFFEQAGLRPGKRNAIAAGAAELGGGLLLAAGLATPVAAAALESVMISAIRHVHWQRGFWSANGGYEFNLVLAAALFDLVEHGPGPLSLDAARGGERKGLGWALAALAAAGAGSVAITELGRRQPVPDEATPRETADTEESAAVS